MTSKVKVSERAMEARIKRALEKQGQILKKCRVDSRFYSDFGDYYIVNQSNNVEATHCTLLGLAKETGLLKAYEELES